LVQFKLNCGKNYFGSNCETFCDDSPANEFYTCDKKTGARICRDGYLGEYCQLRKLILLFCF
jgi:hypothetical protein